MKGWLIQKHDAPCTIRDKISQCLNELKRLKEKYQKNYYLVILSEEKVRSNAQNAFWWGVVIEQCFLPYIQAGMDIWARKTSKKCIAFMYLAGWHHIGIPEHTVFSKDDIHYRIINDDSFDIWNKDWDKEVQVYDKKTGRMTKQILRNTRTLTTVQFSRMMENAAVAADKKWEAKIEFPDDLIVEDKRK